MGYFFGADLSAEALARGMLQAHCTFGVHLDMNPGLAGFEFYDVEPAGVFQPLPRPLQADWEYEGTIRDLPDLHVRARRMTRSMTEVNFPQYIHREARDFFYLTLRSLLPGHDIRPTVEPPEPGEGAWQMKGLPQHGFPYAVAVTTLRPDPQRPAARVRVLRLDPRTIRPAASAGTTEATPTIASFFVGDHGSEQLWWHNGIFLVGGGGHGTRVASGIPFGAAKAASFRAAVGVDDLDGMLDWVEVPSEGAPSLESVDCLLERLGCSRRFVVDDPAVALLGGSTDLAGAAATPPPTVSVRFVRGATPSAQPYFESTPIVGPGVWQPLQSKRIRYFPKPAAPSTSSAPSSPGSAPPAAPSSTASLHP